MNNVSGQESTETSNEEEEEQVTPEDTEKPENVSVKRENGEEENEKRCKRNPLNYVNKTYRGVNKIELEQKLYEESLSRCETMDRRVTRRVVKEITGDVPLKCGEKVFKFYKGQIVWGMCQGWWPGNSTIFFSPFFGKF